MGLYSTSVSRADSRASYSPSPETFRSKCSTNGNIPPKGMSLSDFIRIFAMSIKDSFFVATLRKVNLLTRQGSEQYSAVQHC